MKGFIKLNGNLADLCDQSRTDSQIKTKIQNLIEKCRQTRFQSLADTLSGQTSPASSTGKETRAQEFSSQQ